MVAKKVKKVKKASKKKTAVKKKVSKKTAVKKTSTKKRAVRKRKKNPLTAEEIAYFKELLLSKWKELVGDVTSIEDEALKKSRLDAAGDLSSMPIHMADIGTDNFEQEFALGLMDSERKMLVEITDALKRIQEKTYGICEGTGKPIAKLRLEAKPWARYCIDYARMVEKGIVIEGEQIVSETNGFGGIEDIEGFEEYDDEDNVEDLGYIEIDSEESE